MPSNDPKYDRLYYLRNKERLKLAKHAWYEKNKARILAQQKEYNRTVRTPRNLARRNAKALQKSLLAVRENNNAGPRDIAPQPGGNRLPVGEYDPALPPAPRADAPPGNGLETNSIPAMAESETVILDPVIKDHGTGTGSCT